MHSLVSSQPRPRGPRPARAEAHHMGQSVAQSVLGDACGHGQGQGQQQADEAEDQADRPGRGHRHRQDNRPMYRRLFSAVRRAWTGVKFALDSELDELDSVQTHRPSSLAALVRATRFTEGELKRIYRGFKAECPTGLVKEDAFKLIYQQFFPQGANAGQYAHYVFRTLDQDHSGLLNFENFVHGLSVLSRGSIDEKLRWTFSLYDVNGDGRITREELADVVGSVYEIMGKTAQPAHAADQHAVIQEKVDRIFQKLDLNGDGVVTLDEFLDACLHDEEIKRSMAVFDSCF